MTNRDWEKELAKIDRQMSRMSDDELVASSAPAASPPNAAGGARRDAPAAPASAAAGVAARPPSTAGMLARVALAATLAVAVFFWPYGARCGVGLAGYLGAMIAVTGAGAWAALATWRARAGRAHVFALVIIAWGLALTAVEVLPRVGYANDPGRVGWACGP